MQNHKTLTDLLTKMSQITGECTDIGSDCSHLIEFVQDLLEYENNKFSDNEKKELETLLNKVKEVEKTMKKITDLGNG